jgi:hypothetical protein
MNSNKERLMLINVTEQHRQRYPHARAQVRWLLAQASQHQPREQVWALLEAAHLVGQSRLALHGRVHARMLRQALHEQRFDECAAQLFRLALVPLGHLMQRLPLGNPGSGRVSAFADMPIPHTLEQWIQRSALEITS